MRILEPSAGLGRLIDAVHNFEPSEVAALVMDTSHREKALRHLSTTWEKIPAGAFRTEGTNVPTIMLSITV